MILNHHSYFKENKYLLYRLDKIHPIVYNNTLKNMDKEQQLNIRPENVEGLNKPSTPSRWPLLDALRDRFSLKNINEKLYGGNAGWGHLIAFSAGASTGLLDYTLGLNSEVTILTLAPVSVLVAALLIPFQGYDRIKESKQSSLITFGPMASIGTTAGGMMASHFLQSFQTEEHMQMKNSALDCIETAVSKTDQLGCFDPLISSIDPSLLTFSNTTGLAIAVGVLVSYITVGYMSRDKRWEYLSIRNLAESVKKVNGSMMMWREHIAADRLNSGILAANEWGLRLSLRVLEDLKEKAYEEDSSLKTVAQLLDGTPGADDLMNNPDERLPIRIIEEAQEALVKYHYQTDTEGKAATSKNSSATRLVRRSGRVSK